MSDWQPKHNRWAVALTVTLATFMEVLDTSIANVALPHIAGSLSASQDESTWVLTSYLVSNAIILPISAWLATVLGRKRFYMTCVTLFGVSSFLCGLASSDIAPQDMNWRDRLMSILRTLITVHPAHDEAFAPLEQAVEKNDAQAAQAAFASLPDAKQNGLREWKSRLDTRGAVDDALQTLTAQMESASSDKADAP